MPTDWTGNGWDSDMTTAATLVAVLVVVLVGLWLGRRRLMRRLEERRSRRILEQLGRESMEHVAIPDGLGDENLVLDHVVLLPTGFLVVDVMDYAGVLFAGERIDEWTQTVGRRSYKFTNPIPANRLKVQALQDLFPEVPVHGRVAFTRQGRFATHLPAGACMLDGIRDSIADLVSDEDVPGTHYSAWMRLQREVAIQL